MIPTPAQYLLRIDDLCPTVSHERWRALRSLISEFAIRPILAVVPFNCDPELDHSPHDPAFWDQMRFLESAGAKIGLHGYRHLCASHGRSLFPLHRTSEFAGVAAATQRMWIREGLSILRGHGLNPEIWVAPRHGFDGRTLDALLAEKIHLLSDGFARAPFLHGGVTWIPQQLWGPLKKSEGLWSICMHPNTAREEDIHHLRAFLRTNAAQFTSVDRVLAEIPPTTLTLAERIYSGIALSRVKASRAVKRIPCLPLRSSSRA